MPLYAVECEKCGHIDEALVPVDGFDDWKESLPDSECTECGSRGLFIRICPPTRILGGKCEYNRMMKARFDKRNKRIDAMPEKNKQRFREFIRERGIKRSW